MQGFNVVGDHIALTFRDDTVLKIGDGAALRRGSRAVFLSHSLGHQGGCLRWQ